MNKQQPLFLHERSQQEITDWLITNNEKPFRAKQIEEWVWKHSVSTSREMKNIPRAIQEKLDHHYVVEPLQLHDIDQSEDGETTKFLWKLFDGRFVESVLIRSCNRATVCVSSQVGCPIRCSFCASGKKGLVRNLSASEIVAQILYINKRLVESGEKVTNVVYMGMGEPMKNYENVVGSIRLLVDRFGFSRRRITVSTVGVVEGIKRLAQEGIGVNLALSLHAPCQEIREKIIAYARTVQLSEVMEAVDEYRLKSGRDSTYEYILIAGINDREEDARQLASLLRGRAGSVNLIPYNPVADLLMKRPSREVIERFRAILERENISNTCRYTKGKDIKAACGQLALKEDETVF